MPDPIEVSFSQLDSFRQCPLKWYLSSVERWRSGDENPNLTFGTAWHSVLQIHYETLRTLQVYQSMHGSQRTPKRGTPLWETWQNACAMAVYDWLPENATGDTYNRLCWMYEGYIDRYGLDEQWIIREIEIKGRTELAPNVFLTYIIDLVVEDLEYGGEWAVDHKSCGDLSSDFWIDLDDQGGLYWWAWENDPEHARQVNGFVRSEARKKMNVGDAPGATKGKAQTLAQRFKRQRKSADSAELEVIRRDAYAAAVVMGKLRAGELPLWSAPDPARCGWKCDYKEVHVQMRKNGGDVEQAMGDFGYSKEERNA
jgi:hypothetical protein